MAKASKTSDRLFRAFSDQTRLRILHLLSRREICVGDLVKTIRVPQPTASRHLAYLRKAGLVTTRRSGLWNYYALAPATTRLHKKLVECLQSCFDNLPEIQADARRSKQLLKSGGCCPK